MSTAVLPPPTAEPTAELPVVPARPAAERLLALDGLRFLVALSVVAYHLLGDFDNRKWWVRPTAELFGAFPVAAARYGWLGVEMFFVISGFVICMSSWGRTVSQFFVSRATRLMPAYVFAVLVTATLVYTLSPDGSKPPPTHVLINLTMMQQFQGVPNLDAVYWTLFSELKFYLLFSIVVLLGVTYKRVLAFCALWMVAALMAQQTHWTVLQEFTNSYYASMFVLGVGLFLIYRFGPNLLLWGLVGGSAILSITKLSSRADQNHVRPGVVLAVFGVFLAVMVLVALRKLSWLRWKGLTTLGALTYPLYLLHLQIGSIAVRRLSGTVSPYLLLPAVAVGVLALAYFTAVAIERPLAGRMRRGLNEAFAQVRSADRTSAAAKPAQ